VAGESPGCVQRCEDLEVVRGPSQRSLCSSLPPGSVSNPGLEINLPDEGSPRREVRLDNPDRPVLKLRRSDSHRHQIVRDLVDVRWVLEVRVGQATTPDQRKKRIDPTQCPTQSLRVSQAMWVVKVLLHSEEQPGSSTGHYVSKYVRILSHTDQRGAEILPTHQSQLAAKE
jgi:hypothetical protein